MTAAAHPSQQVVAEEYDEIVMWEPAESFYNRVMAMPKRSAPPSQVCMWEGGGGVCA